MLWFHHDLFLFFLTVRLCNLGAVWIFGPTVTRPVLCCHGQRSLQHNLLHSRANLYLFTCGAGAPRRLSTSNAATEKACCGGLGAREDLVDPSAHGRDLGIPSAALPGTGRRPHSGPLPRPSGEGVAGHRQPQTTAPQPALRGQSGACSGPVKTATFMLPGGRIAWPGRDELELPHFPPLAVGGELGIKRGLQMVGRPGDGVDDRTPGRAADERAGQERTPRLADLRPWQTPPMAGC